MNHEPPAMYTVTNPISVDSLFPYYAPIRFYPASNARYIDMAISPIHPSVRLSVRDIPTLYKND